MLRAPFYKTAFGEETVRVKKAGLCDNHYQMLCLSVRERKRTEEEGVPEKEKDTLISARTSQFKVLHRCFLSLFRYVWVYTFPLKLTLLAPNTPFKFRLLSVFLLNCLKSVPVSTLKVTLRHSRRLHGNDCLTLGERKKMELSIVRTHGTEP